MKYLLEESKNNENQNLKKIIWKNNNKTKQRMFLKNTQSWKLKRFKFQTWNLKM